MPTSGSQQQTDASNTSQKTNKNWSTTNEVSY